MPAIVGKPYGPMVGEFGICISFLAMTPHILNPPLELKLSDFMSASMLFNSILHPRIILINMDLSAILVFSSPYPEARSIFASNKSCSKKKNYEPM